MGRRPRQLVFGFAQKGGPRFESGKKVGRPRKPAKERGVPHGRRPLLSPLHPVLVTLKIRKGLPRMRNRACLRVVEGAIADARERFGMRITDYSLMNDHIHLIVELDPNAADAPRGELCPQRAAKEVLSTGMQGLTTRLARRLNKLWGRSGKVLAGRYHAVAKRTPKEVRNAKAYVLRNARHHGLHCPAVDEASSGQWFDGWLEVLDLPPPPPCPVAAPGTWLGRVGWILRGGGRISAFA
jgi:REP element-mobilizing transposase RayT